MKKAEPERSESITIYISDKRLVSRIYKYSNTFRNQCKKWITLLLKGQIKLKKTFLNKRYKLPLSTKKKVLKIISKMKRKTIIRWHFTITGMTNIKKKLLPNISKDLYWQICRATRTLIRCWLGCKIIQMFLKAVVQCPIMVGSL